MCESMCVSECVCVPSCVHVAVLSSSHANIEPNSNLPLQLASQTELPRATSAAFHGPCCE